MRRILTSSLQWLLEMFGDDNSKQGIETQSTLENIRDNHLFHIQQSIDLRFDAVNSRLGSIEGKMWFLLTGVFIVVGAAVAEFLNRI